MAAPALALPLIMFAMNKANEKRAKEEARKQQLHQIRSQLAASFGAPGYGADAARAKYDTQRQIDSARRQNNSQMLGSVFGAMDGMGAERAPGGAGMPAPPDPGGQLSDFELEELARSREALKGFR